MSKLPFHRCETVATVWSLHIHVVHGRDESAGIVVDDTWMQQAPVHGQKQSGLVFIRFVFLFLAASPAKH
jgi:hypothetical protein